jgi:sporulation protein YabP
MAYDEMYKTAELPHNIIIEGRKRLTVSGAEDVESFDEERIAMTTSRGGLIIFGQGLHIEKLSLDTGDVIVEGTIDRLEYEDEVRESGGFFSRLFR